MALRTLPLPTTPHETYEINLDDNDYQVTFVWNAIDESWYFSLQGISDETVALTGVPLRNLSPILNNRGFYMLGEIALFGTVEPAFDIADTHQLLYRGL